MSAHETLVTNGASLACSFGRTPGRFTVLPVNGVTIRKQPVATVRDTLAAVNIEPFRACSSIANPSVAAATSAAFGVLTPMPCIPVPTSTWQSQPADLEIRGVSALTMPCALSCAWGGTITVLQLAATTSE